MTAGTVDHLFGPESDPNSGFEDLVRRLAEAGVRFERGLDTPAIEAISARAGTPVPPDLRQFWKSAFPVGGRWRDWRVPGLTRADIVDWITDDLQFSVLAGDIWLTSWGQRPRSKSQARRVIRSWVEKGPALLPIYVHRFALCEPELPNTPILSIQGSDWIYYGWNLASYLEAEFLGRDIHSEQPWPAHQSVGQWAEVLDLGLPEPGSHSNVVQSGSVVPPPDWIE